jgi:hypothetical protein
MKTSPCGAVIPVRERLEPRETNRIAIAVVAAVTHLFAMLVATLREIFDESAYQRFLEKSRLESSVEAYAAFQQESEQSKSRRPRCC